jgi:1-acyl-sn-glycerol-3-phosphate acyltransferase
MTALELQKQLRETGAYRTPDAPDRRLTDRLFGRRDGWYYWGALKVLVVGCFRARHGDYAASSWNSSSFETLRQIERCGGRIEIDGMQNLNALKGPAVIVANHMSMVETFVLPVIAMAFTPISIVLKKSLLVYPFLGTILKACESIGVSRSNPREDLKEVIEGGMAQIAKGRSVLLFPQSTRNFHFIPAEFNTLGEKLAKRAGVPIVPVALKTDFQRIGRGRLRDFGPLDRSKTVRFRAGVPRMITSATGKEEHAEIVKFIGETLQSWEEKTS